MIFYFRFSLTANQILDILLEPDEDDVRTNDASMLVLQPPAERPDADTDQDSDASDAEVTSDPAHLPRRILASEAELLSPPDATADGSPDGDDAAQPDLALPGPSMEQPETAARPKKRSKTLPRKWSGSSRRLGENVPQFQDTMAPTQMDILENTISTPAQCLHLFVTDEIISHLVEQSQVYATQKGLDTNVITHSNIRVALAIMMLSGYANVPNRRLYWRRDGDVFNSLVAKGMRRDTFEHIMRVLHLADNSKMDSTNPDPYFKVRPLFKMTNENNKLLPPPEEMSVDECMVPYYGHHPTKQFIRGKPVRFGFKVWALCTADGFLLHAEPYCGKATDLEASGYGQGADVVLGLARKCNLRPGHHLTFDNFFSSLPLLEQLSAAGFGGTGTIRENRIPKDAPLTAVPAMNKSQRGSMSATHTGDIALVRWKDNKTLTMISNKYGTDPIQKASRWSKEVKKKMTVSMPSCVAVYNRTMGGVDLHDQFVASYRIRVRSKKWWWPLFIWQVNSAVVNAWLLYRKLGHDVPLLEFTRQCVLETISEHGREPARPGTRPLPALSSAEASGDGTAHWPAKGSSKYGRCRHCSGRSAYICRKCGAAVHPECMQAYHSRQKDA